MTSSHTRDASPRRGQSTAAPTPATPGLLRSLNNRVVLDLFIQHTTLSRGDVGRLTGLSKPTASQLLVRLEESGLVVDAGVGTPGPGGRAPQLYRLNPRAGYAAALNVTPAEIHVRIVDIVGAPVADLHLADDVDTREVGFRRAVAAIRSAAESTGIAPDELSAVVVGAPGSYDPDADQLRYSDHLHDWQEPGLVAGFESLLACPVRIENDVNLVAVAEHRAASDDADNFFLLWLDERIGGAMVIDGRVYRGSHGAAGEAAFIQPSGVPVVRNPARVNRGGFEDLVGEEAIVRLAADHGISAASASEAMAAAVATNGAEATALLTAIAERYAVGLASIHALLDPRKIVVAGSLATLGGPALRSAITAELSTVALATPPVLGATVTDDPVMSGALMSSLELARDRVFST